MTEPLESALAAAVKEARSWPFEEARRIIKRLDALKSGAGKTVIFETGYGPSGLPHIGTFGEVARTAMVRHAFEILTEGKIKTRLICFSDDMDGLRKVPDNVPNKDMLAAYLDKPLTSVPDPFDNEHPSFAHHNNAMLRSFLDRFGFQYEFFSATETYKAGTFDETLLKMLKAYDKVMDIILPTLGPERRATYSPFLPVCPRTGKVLQVPMVERHPKKGTIVYLDPDTAKKVETAVTGGAVKCQWKADWALRWTALGVDYEMCGKDLIDSVTLSSKICRALGGTPPENLVYELFLDDKGGKISKSKGNGLTIEEWLTYASPESLSLFMFQKPKAAKRLYFDVIPRTVDEYLQFLAAYPRQDAKGQIDNAVWHIHGGHPPAAELPISFGLLLNLTAASNAHDKDVLWGFIRRHAPAAGPQTHPLLDQLAGYAVRYYEDFVKPQKKFRPADAVEAGALQALADALGKVPPDAKAEDLQTLLYDVGRSIPRYQDFNAKGATPDKPGVSNAWFGTIYQVLLGEERGPRFGSFIELYGVENTRALIGKALKGELVEVEPKRQKIDRSKLPVEFPTHKHGAEFWEALGRTVAAFGFLEEVLGKAIFAFTATTEVAENISEAELQKWQLTLERALDDPLGKLIDAYGRAVRAHNRATIVNLNELLSDLRQTSNIRNVLCHGSWAPPNDRGQSVPLYVDKKLGVFETPIDIAFLKRVRKHVVELSCTIIDTVTDMGWQFPGTGGSGKSILYLE